MNNNIVLTIHDDEQQALMLGCFCLRQRRQLLQVRVLIMKQARPIYIRRINKCHTYTHTYKHKEGKWEGKGLIAAKPD